MAGLGFSRLHLLPLSTSSRPTSAVALSGRYLPCLSPITWGLALAHHPRLSPLLSKPMLNPQVLAASSPLRALFTPAFFPPKPTWLCTSFQGVGFQGGARESLGVRDRGEGMACHGRYRPSPPESRPEEPPLIPCFCRKRQPPPASQTGGSRRLQVEASLSTGPHLVTSVTRSGGKRQREPPWL